jgi:hypothetical protein
MKKVWISILTILTFGNLIFFATTKDRYAEDVDILIDSMRSVGNALAVRNIINTDVRLLRNEDGQLSDALRRSRMTIVVLLDPTGCGSCLDENVLWNEISETGLMKVLIIMNHDNYNESMQYLENVDIKAPIFLDSNYLSVNTIRPRQLPVKLLVNQMGDILLADYVRQTTPEREAFLSAVRRLKDHSDE